VVLEAMRECLRDVYDLDGLRELMADVRARRIRVVEVDTAAASPFARSLLFGYVGMFLYATDTPLAERRAAALSLDSSLLAELLGTESIRDLLDADVIDQVERSLQRTEPDRNARGVEDTADLLRILGDLAVEEAAARGVRPEWLRRLESDRRAIRVRIGGEQRYLAIEDAGISQDQVGLYEINEAFAAVGLASMDELGIDDEVVNVNGGAIALGHPLGCSGNRITLALLHEMRRRGVEYGAAGLCGGGGQGDAIIVKARA
jgi:hypothetical protein